LRRAAERLSLMKVVGRFTLALAQSSTQRKHLLRWLRSREPGYLLNHACPWITFDAIDHLEAFIGAERRSGRPVRVFEYGSGGSTLFWMRAGAAACVSVEHDETWSSLVRNRIDQGRVDYRLIPPETAAAGDSGDPSDPRSHASDDQQYRSKTFRRYAGAIDEFPDTHFSIVLVDGRARPSCVMHAVPKVMVGGLLVLDNADRDYYTRNTLSLLRDYERLQYPGAAPVNAEFTQTDVFIRRNVSPTSGG
jgi:hypothetical protein